MYVSNKPLASRGKNEGHVFTIVDLDKAKTYPQNFVCLLPQLSSTARSTSAFSKIFGKQNCKVAKKLLIEALRNERDPNIKAEIQKRLIALNPKSILELECIRCGTTFSPKTFRGYKQRICQACRTKPTNTVQTNSMVD